MVCFLCVIVGFIPYIDDYHHHVHDGDKFFLIVSLVLSLLKILAYCHKHDYISDSV